MPVTPEVAIPLRRSDSGESGENLHLDKTLTEKLSVAGTVEETIQEVNLYSISNTGKEHAAAGRSVCGSCQVMYH